MRAYTIEAGNKEDDLKQVDVRSRALGPRDVRVSIRAAALNYRDIQVGRGSYDNAGGKPIIPLSDGSGEVIEIGASVGRFAVGDRVLTTFFPSWIDGPISAEKTAAHYGANSEGILAQESVFDEDALAHAPSTLNDGEAATLVCAGVTAWNALFVQGAARPGQRILILGTGGVAIWSLQLAVAAGLDPIVTSSSDEKLTVARSTGARDLINYQTTPEWQDEVARITGGQGVDLVLEVGGENTLPRSIASTKAGGKVIVIGGLSGFSGASIEPHSLIVGARTLAAVMVGSRSMLEDLGRFVDRTGIKPVIAREFAFDETKAAYDFLEAGRALGKVVIRVG